VQQKSERKQQSFEIQSNGQQSGSDRQEWESERQQWKCKGKQHSAETRDIKSRWKQAAKELNGLRAQGQSFYQATDNYSCGMIIQLIYKLRDFGIQYFSDKLSTRPKFEKNRVWKAYMVLTTVDESYLDFINSPEARPSIIQAFLWKVIVNEVFFRFRWAGSASLPVMELWNGSESCHGGGKASPDDSEATRRLNDWKATTVGLLLDFMDQHKRCQADSELQKWKRELHDEVRDNLCLLRSKDQKGWQQDFLDIIDEAVKIDMEIRRQTSRVTWSFGDETDERTCSPATMELRKGEVFIPNS
jgi:hypothetical protein